jgi:hypothetical protein
MIRVELTDIRIEERKVARCKAFRKSFLFLGEPNYNDTFSSFRGWIFFFY